MFEDRRAVFCAASENESLSAIGIETGGLGWHLEWRVGAGLWRESASEGRAYRDVIPSRKSKNATPLWGGIFQNLAGDRVEIEGTRRWERAGSRRGQTFVSSVFGRGEGGHKASLWCQFSWACFAMLLIES